MTLEALPASSSSVSNVTDSPFACFFPQGPLCLSLHPYLCFMRALGFKAINTAFESLSSATASTEIN